MKKTVYNYIKENKVVPIHDVSDTLICLNFWY